MKRTGFFIWIIITLVANQLCGQSSGLIDSSGVFRWQYHRSIYKNAEDTTTAVVVIVFINGAKPSAITYRQEIKNSSLKWLEKDGGITHQDGYVKVITTRLDPNEAVVWRYTIKNQLLNHDGSIDVEEGAILIMDSRYQVKKEKFAEQKVK